MNEKLKGLKMQSLYLAVVAFLVIGVLVAYALVTFSVDFVGNKENGISTCALDLSFKDTNPINLVSAVPIDDADAKEYEPYVLTIKNNNSGCSNIGYTITMRDFCLDCGNDGNSCDVNGVTCDCRDGYKISGEFIKFEVVNDATGESVKGVDPFKNLSVKGTLASASAVDTYSIRMWISSEATGDDLYVKGTDGNYLEDESGKIITKNFCSKVKLEVNAE